MSQGPTKTTSLAEIKKANVVLPPDTQASFFTVGGFDLMQRGAHLLASSTLVPVAYRNEVEDKKTGMLVKNPNAMSNCVLALNMAQRIQADPLMIMQNLYIVEGRPGWSSQFVIASINACGKFSPLRFKMEDKGAKEVEWTTTVWEGPQGQRRRREVQHKAIIQNKECTAWAIEKATGERLDGPTVSMEMAVQEGWFGKNGSKWQTMPDVMLRYRAASFFGKLYAPELLMGLQSAEEIHDTTITIEPERTGQFLSLEDVNPTPSAKTRDGETVNPETSEESENAKPAETPAPWTEKKRADRRTTRSARRNSPHWPSCARKQRPRGKLPARLWTKRKSSSMPLPRSGPPHNANELWPKFKSASKTPCSPQNRQCPLPRARKNLPCPAPERRETRTETR